MGIPEGWCLVPGAAPRRVEDILELTADSLPRILAQAQEDVKRKRKRLRAEQRQAHPEPEPLALLGLPPVLPPGALAALAGPDEEEQVPEAVRVIDAAAGGGHQVTLPAHLQQ